MTGTTHVFHGSAEPYAMRDPSGEKTGACFSVSSRVNCAGSPSGNIFT